MCYNPFAARGGVESVPAASRACAARSPKHKGLADFCFKGHVMDSTGASGRGIGVGNILFLSAYKVYYLVLMVLFYAYAPIYFGALGFSERQTGVLFALQSSMAIAAYLPSGYINDTLAARYQIALGAAGIVSFAFGLARASAYWHFAALFALWGFSATMIDNSTNIIYYKESRGAASGVFFAFYGITGTLAYAAGGGLGDYILAGGDFPALFKFVFVMSLPLLPVAFFLPSARTSKAARISEYYREIARPEVAALAATLFLFTYHWGAELVSFTMLMKKGMGLSLASISYVYLEVGLVMSAVIFTLGISGGRLKIPLRAAIVAAALISASAQASFVFAGSFYGAFANQLLHAVGDALFVYYWMNAIPRVFAYERAGGASSFVNWFTVISVIAGSAVSGWAAARFENHYAPFLISAALMLLILPIQARSNALEADRSEARRETQAGFSGD